MNGKNWIATPLLAGMLALVPGSPCAAADDPPAEKKDQHDMSAEAHLLPGTPGAESFGPQPKYDDPYSADAQLAVYNGKHLNKTAFPPVDLGLQLYERGAYDPRPTWLGTKNPDMSAFMAYGDLRVAAADYDNGVAGANGKTQHSEVAARLNLDMDWALTPTERIHAFARPFDRNGMFTRYQFDNGLKGDRFVEEFNFQLKTLFFEGDLGQMAQGLTNRTNSHDIPIAVGRVPIATQNGIWIEDAFDGLAVSLFTARNSPALDVSNTDLTFFAGFNNVATAAVKGDQANIYGLAGFADAFKGYVEYGYGYVDADNPDLSYHNLTAAFSRRYFGRIANSIRVIGNFGQKGLPGLEKTADGVLLLVENSFIPRYSPVGTVLNLVPYVNLFGGFRSPQSLARAADSGGILRNTGINFESDGLTGYPTLDATAHDSYGGAFGVEYLFNLDRQIVVEGAVVQRRGNNPLGDQYAIGARYQHPISNAWIVRLDAMKGWRQGMKNIFGARLEVRRKI